VFTLVFAEANGFPKPAMQDAPTNNVMVGFSLGGRMSRSRKKHPITGITTAET
jgi:hypothetical protein